MKEIQARLTDYPFALEPELRDAANEHGYRIAQEQAAGWLIFSSASAPGEIAVAATKTACLARSSCPSLTLGLRGS